MENARRLPLVYPDWKGVFFVDDFAWSKIGVELEESGCLVIRKGQSEGHRGMLWRFEAVTLTDARRVIVRDVDSRVTSREARAVDEWIKSGFSLHVIRDHPWHTRPVMGGMWGIQGAKNLQVISQEIQRVKSLENGYGEDQEWISRIATKHFWDSKLVHDSFPLMGDKVQSLPPREGREFIGERIDCNGNPELAARKSLDNFERSHLRRITRRFLTRRNLATTFFD